jgi:hypothetical protein
VLATLEAAFAPAGRQHHAIERALVEVPGDAGA